MHGDSAYNQSREFAGGVADVLRRLRRLASYWIIAISVRSERLADHNTDGNAIVFQGSMAGTHVLLQQLGHFWIRYCDMSAWFHFDVARFDM